jgi:hypothetical protein
MRISARDLAPGDVIRLHDWQLHVVTVEHGLATAVLTSEFDFLLHFGRDESLEVARRHRAPFAAA